MTTFVPSTNSEISSSIVPLSISTTPLEPMPLIPSPIDFEISGPLSPHSFCEVHHIPRKIFCPIITLNPNEDGSISLTINRSDSRTCEKRIPECEILPKEITSQHPLISKHLISITSIANSIAEENFNHWKQHMVQVFEFNGESFPEEMLLVFKEAYFETIFKRLPVVYESLDKSFSRYRLDSRIIENFILKSHLVSIYCLNKQRDGKPKSNNKSYSKALSIGNPNIYLDYPVLGRSTIDLTKIIENYYQTQIETIATSSISGMEHPEIEILERQKEMDLEKLLKCTDLYSLDEEIPAMAPIIYELRIMQHLKDVAGVISLLGVRIYQSCKRNRPSQKIKMVIYTEHYFGESLHSFLKQKPELPDREIFNIASQMAQAIKNCHDHDITHQDIKLQNMLIRKISDSYPQYQLVLTDFGTGAFLDDIDENTFTNIGTILYLSPEKISFLTAHTQLSKALNSEDPTEIERRRELYLEKGVKMNHFRQESDVYSTAFCIFQLLNLLNHKDDLLKPFISAIANLFKVENRFKNLRKLTLSAKAFCKARQNLIETPYDLAIYNLIRSLIPSPENRTTAKELIESLEMLQTTS